MPQCEPANGSSGVSSRSVSSAPRKKKLPRCGWMSIVFLPTHPSPARRAKSRSSSGAVSATASARAARRLGFEPRREVVEAVPDEPVVVGARRRRPRRDQESGAESVRQSRVLRLAVSARAPSLLPVLHPQHHHRLRPRPGSTRGWRRGVAAAGGGSPSRRRTRGRASRRSARTRRRRSPGRCPTSANPARGAGFRLSRRVFERLAPCSVHFSMTDATSPLATAARTADSSSVHPSPSPRSSSARR